MNRFPAGGRVLVVDDQDLAREVMCSMLEREGFLTEPCDDGEHALAQVAKHRYDAVVVDVMMPDIGGIEVCRRIRAAGDLTTPVLLVTASPDHATRIAGKQAGADDFLMKPLDPVEVGSRVRCLQRVRAWYDQVESERDRFEVELGKAQRSIGQIERMATVGNMAAGLGHEVKNLAQILSGLDEFLGEGGDGAEVRGDIAEVGARLARLGRHLMNLGREDEPEATFDLVEGVARTVMLCQASGRLRRLRLTSDLGDAPVLVWGRASDADQIVLNLLGNAIDAVDGRLGAQVRLSIRVREGRCRLEVADNGPGLAPAAKDRLFEPYVTTKPAGAGTGLGLTVSRRLAGHMGGAIGLVDRPEGGALAWVELPTRRPPHA